MYVKVLFRWDLAQLGRDVWLLVFDGWFGYGYSVRILIG